MKRHRPVGNSTAATPPDLALVIRAHNRPARSPLGVACDTRIVRRLMAPLLEMRAADLLAVIQVVAAHTESWWVAGGWGVDALVGRQTRRHADVDIIIGDDERELAAVIAGLGQLGLGLLTVRHAPDLWTPRRVSLADNAGHGVDLLPVDLSDWPFRPTDGQPAAFTTGVVAGHQVPCMSEWLQVQHHRGYGFEASDRHDMGILLGADPQAKARRTRRPSP